MWSIGSRGCYRGAQILTPE